MSIHDRFRNVTAPSLLARFTNGGVSAKVRTIVPALDPLSQPTVFTESVEFNAVAFGVTAKMVESDPNLQASDLWVVCAAVDYVPVVGGVVNINGADRRIIRVDAIVASGPAAAYKFYVR